MAASLCGAQISGGLREQVMVDCSHANSNKSHLRQIDVAQRRRRSRSPHGERRIIGVMIESHLEEGRQDLKPGVPLRHGVSITDACLGWDANRNPCWTRLAETTRKRSARVERRRRSKLQR